MKDIKGVNIAFPCFPRVLSLIGTFSNLCGLKCLVTNDPVLLPLSVRFSLPCAFYDFIWKTRMSLFLLFLKAHVLLYIC